MTGGRGWRLRLDSGAPTSPRRRERAGGVVKAGRGPPGEDTARGRGCEEILKVESEPREKARNGDKNRPEEGQETKSTEGSAAATKILKNKTLRTLGAPDSKTQTSPGTASCSRTSASGAAITTPRLVSVQLNKRLARGMLGNSCFHFRLEWAGKGVTPAAIGGDPIGLDPNDLIPI